MKDLYVCFQNCIIKKNFHSKEIIIEVAVDGHITTTQAYRSLVKAGEMIDRKDIPYHEKNIWLSSL